MAVREVRRDLALRRSLQGEALLRLLMDYAAHATSVLTEAYGRERELMLAETLPAGDDLLEELLAGRRPRLLEVRARQAGLDPRGSFETAVVAGDELACAA